MNVYHDSCRMDKILGDVIIHESVAEEKKAECEHQVTWIENISKLVELREFCMTGRLIVI